MRGGVNSGDLLYNTDVGDLEILSHIVEDNIDTVKKTGMPLI